MCFFGLGSFGAALFGAVRFGAVLFGAGHIGGVKVKIKELGLGSEG